MDLSMPPMQRQPVDPLDSGRLPKPPWIRARIPSGENYEKIKSLVREKRLHTVCAEALCPNLGECWGRGNCDVPHPRRSVHEVLQFLWSAHRCDGSGPARRGCGSCGRGFDP
ncbi:MAG: hypothetical protein ABSH41_26940 [Syntrophobacteraceae bacterium]